MFDIIIGRNESNRKKLGKEGTVLIGKQYVKMGQTTSLSNKVYLDVTDSHIVFICGKRGGGKSYTMGVIAEGVSDLPQNIKQNISIVILDTMGIYWTMKYPNHADKELLEEWGLEPKGLDVKIYTPVGYFNEYKEKGIPTDYPFSIQAHELSGSDWCMTFGCLTTEPMGILIEKTIYEMKESMDEFTIDNIIEHLKSDTQTEQHVVNATINEFVTATEWGLFSEKGMPIEQLAAGGNVSILDVSCYATQSRGWEVKSLVIGLVAQKLFNRRMQERKDEEFLEVKKEIRFEDDGGAKKEYPLVWLVIDEAHEFMPVKGKTTATDALVTILREGRQPGISLILATQQPGKIHTDVMTQSDTIISHRITAKLDTDALGMLMQSYMREGLDVQLDNLPRVKGAAIILDDSNEKMYPIRIRPRFTWHGGSAPSAIHKKKEWF